MSKQDWSIEQSERTYHIRGWGRPYFAINEAGNVTVTPDPEQPQQIDLHSLVSDLVTRGTALPLLIRFPDILHDRIRSLNHCFRNAIDEYDYRGSYRGVYPVKVNQQRHLVEDVVRAGKAWHFGLEAGSKPELLIALSAMDEEGGLIICNGYKDLRYIETALVAQRFGHSVVVVLERAEELDLVFQAYEKLGIRPMLGVRAKLNARGLGRWSKSSGEHAKFGLSASAMVSVAERLRERDMLDCLQLLHFHVGSQVSSIVPLKNALREAANVYVELCRLGGQMRYFDVGGGLAVDYDGSRTDFHASRNYDIQEYAYDVVIAIKSACQRAGVAEPTIVSESGRAVAAYQSVLVFEVVGADQLHFAEPDNPATFTHRTLRDLYETWQGIAPKNVQEAWHDACQSKEEAQNLFKFGYLSLRELADAERLYWCCCHRIFRMLRELPRVPEELKSLQRILSAIYYCNFSVFQSAPDVWAIEQLFPIMPIHRLTEQPTVSASLADLTCDSDGQVDAFIDEKEIKPWLPVHPFRSGEPYMLGMFLNGAYQEILGDLHNLFGDTNAVHVRVEDKGYHVDHLIPGDRIEDVLRYVQYEPKTMLERVRHQAERAIRQGTMTLEQMRVFIEHYEASMRSYTYLS